MENVYASALVAALFVLVLYKAKPSRRKTTPLRGPPNPSYLFGVVKTLRQSSAVTLYGTWAREYGNAFKIPSVLWTERIVICDPKALTHFYSKDSMGYVSTAFTRRALEKLFGRGLLWAEGEAHRRQRKALAPAFSNGEIKKMTSVFYDSVYKMKVKWDELIERDGSGTTVLDVAKWGSRVALDAVGIAGFGHDFQTLEGKDSAVTDLFDSFIVKQGDPFDLIFFLGFVFPIFNKLPNARNRMIAAFSGTFKVIADDLIAKCRSQEEFGGEKSILGMLIRAEGNALSTEELIAQNVLILAGFESTSITLTWALIELCRHTDKQQRLREEVSLFREDLTFEQLVSPSLAPYLDAVVHEVLRLHPALGEITRMATEDDVIPLSEPVLTADGRLADSIFIQKGMVVVIPMEYVNQAKDLWGEGATGFNPDRWIDGSVKKELPGYKHILTFSDGPRTCLGKTFAIVELKVLLCVLMKNFSFEFLDGEREIDKVPSLLPRPRVVGHEGPVVPLRIRRVYE